ncbi:MAG: hypothetical protein ATN35_00895 [Epulopiscium sp. Nele67-Bin004]|nr:MAG: hypothetical protein ATN35_00895 [Epulopiscium sp. Nele67-Bin004]
MKIFEQYDDEQVVNIAILKTILGEFMEGNTPPPVDMSAEMQSLNEQLQASQDQVKQLNQQVTDQLGTLQVNSLRNTKQAQTIENLENTLGKIEIEFADTKQKKGELEESIWKYQEKIETLEGIVETTNRQLAELQSSHNEVAMKLNEAEKVTSYYTTKYAIAEQLHRSYDKLTMDAQDGIANIFRNATTIMDMILCIGDYDKIKMFWEYVVYLYINEEETADELREVFDLMFEMYMKMYPQFERVEVAAGEAFDTDDHIRIGLANNIITSVKFRGIKNTNTGKLIQKSVVTV